MVLFVLAVNKGLCTTFRTVLVKMAFVHKQPVNTQLFKGDHIILALSGAQLFQFGFQCFPCLFHLLDTVKFSPLGFQFVDGIFDFINLLLMMPSCRSAESGIFSNCEWPMMTAS